MNVSCPECQSIFRVDPAKVPPAGVRARCSVCGGVITIGIASIDEEFAPVVSAAVSETAPYAGQGWDLRAGVAPIASHGVPSSAPSVVPRSDAVSGRAAEMAESLAPTGMPLAAPPAAQSAPPAITPPKVLTTSATFARAPAFAPRPPETPAPADSALSRTDDLTPSPMPPTPPALKTPPRPVVPPGRAAMPAGPRLWPPTPAFSAPAVSQRARPQTPAGARPPVGARAPVVTPAGRPTPVRAPINPFLASDPNAKARRLARALVSDLVTYFPRQREEGLREGTLKQLFREEIRKSYDEYVDQVGADLAESTRHFQEALNDILAGGDKIF